jgi:hypothetical protein
METSPSKTKRAPTNVTGPVAWNEEVLAVFKDMGAQLGIVYDECKDHKDFLASCKALGVTRSHAMQEASRRRQESGASPSKKSPAKERLTSLPEEASVLSTPPKRKGAKAKAEEEAPGAPEKLKSLPEIERLRSDTAKDLRLLAETLAEVTEAGMRYQIIKGVRYLVEITSLEVIEIEQIGSMGPRIGTLNEATGEIEAM